MRWIVSVAVVGLGLGAAGSAEAFSVVPVPKNPQDVNVPHNAYNGKATTYKAIVRDGNCGQYTYWWDPDGPGPIAEQAQQTTADPYNLGFQYTYPNQAADKLFAARVRVQCGAEEAIGTYLVYVTADVPGPGNANNATVEQLAIMSDVALDDVLWNLHREMISRGGNGAAITGYVDHQTNGVDWDVATTGAALWAWSLNGHFPAYPPATYAGPEPAGCLAKNNQLWARSPYSESAMRGTKISPTRRSTTKPSPSTSRRPKTPHRTRPTAVPTR